MTRDQERELRRWLFFAIGWRVLFFVSCGVMLSLYVYRFAMLLR